MDSTSSPSASLPADGHAVPHRADNSSNQVPDVLQKAGNKVPLLATECKADSTDTRRLGAPAVCVLTCGNLG